MFSAFFGHYLLNEKIITKKQLKDALALLDTLHIKLGTMAINRGFMTVAQVEEVHEMQLTCDRLFGDLAVESKYLTQLNLNRLLKTQKSENLLFAQSLIQLGIFSYNAYYKHIQTYKSKYELTEDAFEALKSGDVEGIVPFFLHFEDTEYSSFYIDYVTLFIKNQIRFINPHISLQKATLITKNSYDHLIRQTFYSDINYFSAIAGDTQSFNAFAHMYADEKFKVFGDYPIDAVGEYMHQNNKLFVDKKTDQGMNIRMDVHTHIEAPILKPTKKLYDIPIHCVCGEIHLILGQL